MRIDLAIGPAKRGPIDPVPRFGNAEFLPRARERDRARYSIDPSGRRRARGPPGCADPVVTGYQHPFVSVVEPVRNEAGFIEETIGQLVVQDYPADRFEVLVVDGRSADRRGSLPRPWPRSIPR